MSIWDKLRGELIDIVQWLDDSRDTLVYRFERMNNEIKYGAKLTVREGQAAVFVNEGQIADVFSPGMYTLTTQNLPILATLKGWKHGFESPFKAEVYFVNTRQFTDCKWGTMNPIMLRDAQFGPIRLRAFGTYAFKCVDAGLLIKEVAGTAARFSADGITEQLRNAIVARFADIVGESKIPALDLAANYDELSKFIVERIRPQFAALGLDVTAFYVENISLPPEVEAALDKRSSMGILGNLQQYTQYQMANAIGDAAKNPGGGGMSEGMGLGAGLAMGAQMAATMGGTVGGRPGFANAPTAPVGGTPPPLPGAPAFFVGIDGQQAGPFDQSALTQLAASGKLSSQTLVWRTGMTAWTPAGQVAELATILGGSVPPPLPPR